MAIIAGQWHCMTQVTNLEFDVVQFYVAISWCNDKTRSNDIHALHSVVKYNIVHVLILTTLWIVTKSISLLAFKNWTKLNLLVFVLSSNICLKFFKSWNTTVPFSRPRNKMFDCNQEIPVDSITDFKWLILIKKKLNTNILNVCHAIKVKNIIYNIIYSRGWTVFLM